MKRVPSDIVERVRYLSLARPDIIGIVGVLVDDLLNETTPEQRAAASAQLQERSHSRAPFRLYTFQPRKVGREEQQATRLFRRLSRDHRDTVMWWLRRLNDRQDDERTGNAGR